MARKNQAPSIDHIADALRAQSFDVTTTTIVSGGLQVGKYGCAAVLVSTAPTPEEVLEEGAGQFAYAVRPGVLVAGEIATLLDRGYQKFLKTAKYELPATAEKLAAVHRFTEELNRVTGTITLYNLGLGTVSDLYQYDRVKGREAAQAPPVRPWELVGGH